MKRIRLSIIVAVFIVASGCSDFFELDRPPELPWGTITEFERAPIGAYTSLFSGDQWNMAFVNERVVKTSTGDDIGFATDPSYGYNRNSKEFNVYNFRNWIQLYRVVATVNNALDFLAAHNGNPYPDLSPAETSKGNLDRITGELHFIRGYAYYMLQTTFGRAYIPGGDNSTVGIAMPTALATSAIEARNPKMATTQEVYDLILSDLIKAKELLPLKFEPSKHHPSYEVRANRFAASGMLVRTYLQRGEFDKAKLECDFIIDQNNGEYNLSEDPIVAFSKSSVSRGKEVIFYAPFYDVNRDSPNHLSVHNQAWSGSATPWVETHMALSTVKRVGFMTDPKNDTTLNIAAKRDKRFLQLMAVRYPYNQHLPNQSFETRAGVRDYTTIITNKYYRGPNGLFTNVPLIRLAEIILTRSILRFKSGDASGAAADLNVVRKRAWDVAIGGPYVPINSSVITEQMINDERVIEMLNEGDRIDYLRGIKAPIPQGDRGSSTDPYTSENFVWAIPAIELNFNDGI